MPDRRRLVSNFSLATKRKDQDETGVTDLRLYGFLGELERVFEMIR